MSAKRMTVNATVTIAAFGPKAKPSQVLLSVPVSRDEIRSKARVTRKLTAGWRNWESVQIERFEKLPLWAHQCEGRIVRASR